jgi:hypothetical protein
MNRTELTRKARAAAAQLLEAKGYISPVEVLIAMGKLSRENHQRWRCRQVPHLEKVLPGSLNQFQFLLRFLRSHARDELGLKPSRTVYTSWGKGRRQPLRFTKYGNPHLEELYSTHYISGRLATAKPELPNGVPPAQPEAKSLFNVSQPVTDEQRPPKSSSASKRSSLAPPRRASVKLRPNPATGSAAARVGRGAARDCQNTAGRNSLSPFYQ